MNSKGIFRYSYSAKQNTEVLEIRSKYLPWEESGLEELKRLDDEVSSAGLMQSIAVGITRCLVFGLGMCIAMEVLVGGMILGTLVGICGMVIMMTAYPIYHSCYRKARSKHQPRILELVAELSHTSIS